MYLIEASSVLVGCDIESVGCFKQQHSKVLASSNKRSQEFFMVFKFGSGSKPFNSYPISNRSL